MLMTYQPVMITVTASTKGQQILRIMIRTRGSQVIVFVLGANLYSPVFSQRFYLAEVPENAPPGSKVTQVTLIANLVFIAVPPTP